MVRFFLDQVLNIFIPIVILFIKIKSIIIQIKWFLVIWNKRIQYVFDYIYALTFFFVEAYLVLLLFAFYFFFINLFNSFVCDSFLIFNHNLKKTFVHFKIYLFIIRNLCFFLFFFAYIKLNFIFLFVLSKILTYVCF